MITIKNDVHYQMMIKFDLHHWIMVEIDLHHAMISNQKRFQLMDGDHFQSPSNNGNQILDCHLVQWRSLSIAIQWCWKLMKVFSMYFKSPPPNEVCFQCHLLISKVQTFIFLHMFINFAYLCLCYTYFDFTCFHQFISIR